MTLDRTLDSLPALSTFYGTYPDENWSAIGLKLKQEFKDLDVTLALHGVGAIPFYSECRTIDMWGLNDRFVAHQGLLVGENYQRPGHRRRAPLSYLRQQKVTFCFRTSYLKTSWNFKKSRFPTFGSSMGQNPTWHKRVNSAGYSCCNSD